MGGPSESVRGANRVNWRNEAIKLRGLLTSACTVLDAYYPDLMSQELRDWWRAQKNRKMQERILASEEGVADEAIQGITMEEDLQECCY